MADGKLTPKQRAFVREYLVDLNATQAAIRAGYTATNADVTGPRLLGNVGVKALIAKGTEERERRSRVSIEMIDRRLASLAGINVEEDVEAAEATRDQLKALELLGKARAMFTDKLEHSGYTTVDLIDAYGDEDE